MVAQLTFGVQTAGVVVTAEVVEAGSRVGQQAPYHDQDGAGHRHQGFEFSTPLDDAPIACAEEGVGASGHGGCLAERPFEIRVAVAGLAATVHRPGLDGAWTQLRPRHQMRCRWEPGHVHPDLGDDELRGHPAHPRDFGEAVDGAELARAAGTVLGAAISRIEGREPASVIVSSITSIRAVRVAIWPLRASI